MNKQNIILGGLHNFCQQEAKLDLSSVRGFGGSFPIQREYFKLAQKSELKVL